MSIVARGIGSPGGLIVTTGIGIFPSTLDSVRGGPSSKQPHGGYIRYPGTQKRQKFDRQKLAALAILAIHEYYD